MISIFKRIEALFSIIWFTSIVKEQIKEMEVWEKNKTYSSIHYYGFKLSDNFEKELTRLKLNEHKKVLEFRELVKKHNEINIRLLEKHRQNQKIKQEEERLNLPSRISAIEKELSEVKDLLSKLNK